MKTKEKILWLAVLVALAANIWLPKHLQRKYSWDRDLSQRLAADFTLTEKQMREQLREMLPEVTDGQIGQWIQDGTLESMQIGRRTMFFHNAVPNLPRLVPGLAGEEERLSGHQAVDAAVIPVIKEGDMLPKKMRVRFSLTVPKGTLRPGKVLRCWLPFPRKDVARQTGVELIEAGVNDTAFPADQIVFSDPSCAHSSIYMEAKTNRYKDITFYEVFEYTSEAEWHDLDRAKVLAYDKEAADYKEYTSEREAHVIFTGRIKALADSLTAGIADPCSQAKALFTWIDGNIPWASAREYSTIGNIPEYVLASGHGDCGQQTLLFMTLCRFKGIPTRWQSGLMMHPGAKNLHDWCEAYFEGYGWVPVDQSFGITPYGGSFYFGGIEPYRMVVNNDFGRSLSPAKKYPRSDTVDFQRGEVEWEGGNLYYNQWDYNFEIEYL